MKKWIATVLLMTLFVPLLGCETAQPEESTLISPVRFYYRRTEPVYAGEDSVISSELREAAQYGQDYVSLLNLYLKGPQTEGFRRTFPKNVTVLELNFHDTGAVILLNDEFSYLTGLDLTFACACLTLTVCELTGVRQLTIDTPNSLLDGGDQITMDLDSILRKAVDTP